MYILSTSGTVSVVLIHSVSENIYLVCVIILLFIFLSRHNTLLFNEKTYKLTFCVSK